MQNAQKSGKRIEPEILDALRWVGKERAQVALKKCPESIHGGVEPLGNSVQQGKFLPRGIRILVELQRNGSSKLRRQQLLQMSIHRLGHLKHVHLFPAKNRL